MSKPRVLLYDLETFPHEGLFWGQVWETNIIKVTKYGGIASVAWKWYGEKKVHCLTREGKKTDKEIVKKLSELLEEADVAVAHNGIQFDDKVSRTSGVKQEVFPLAPVKVVDTKRLVKKHFGFYSNKLEDVAQFLGIGRKLPHRGLDMWLEAEMDKPEAWKEMRKYNCHDVFPLLEGVYERVLPWANTTPNLALIAGRPEACPKCLAEGTLQARGFQYTATKKYRRFQCTSCGGWTRAAKAEKQ